MRKTPTLQALTAAVLLAAGPAQASGLTTLYTFTGGADGGYPFAGLLPAPDGSFYGTTTFGSGTVFRLSPPAQGARRPLTGWTLTTLHSFGGGPDGAFPQTLVMDRSGALYGMTDEGGLFNGTCAQGGRDIGCGTVFRLTPPAPGNTAWTFSTIWTFTGGADGASPTGGVVLGAQGQLFGFTTGGFTCGQGVCGGVYRLDPPGPGRSGWTETTLYSFKGGRDGSFAGSYGPPVMGADGAIFGVTGSGGDIGGASCAPGGCGTVFRLDPAAGSGPSWHKQTLMTFNGANGIDPVGGLTIDRSGHLFGATNAGGRLTACRPGAPYPNGCGVAFEISPPPENTGTWTASILHRFTNGADGGYPFGAPLRAGNRVFATTSGDEAVSFGSLVEILPPGGARDAWRLRTLFDFTGDANGVSPIGTPAWVDGALYGTTYGGGFGAAPFGTVFVYAP